VEKREGKPVRGPSAVSEHSVILGAREKEKRAIPKLVNESEME